MNSIIHEYKDAELIGLKDIYRYYSVQKERRKIQLETKSLNKNEKLVLYKKLSVYALKIELIKYCIEKNETKPL